MWHVSITVINPFCEEEKIWHDIPLKDVDIVLAYNGCNHYSGSIFIEDPHIRLSPRKFRVTFKKLPEGFPRKPNLAPDEIKTECEEIEMDINETPKTDTPDKDIPDRDLPDRDLPDKDIPDKDRKGLDKLLDETQKKDETLVDKPVEKQYSDISEDKNGNPAGDQSMETSNNILRLVDQSISAAESTFESHKKCRKPPHPMPDKKRMKSDSEEEKLDIPSHLFGSEFPAVQGDLATQLMTYKFLDQNIRSLCQNVDDLQRNLVSISSCLEQAEVYRNNVKMSLENLGIPEQILEEDRDENSDIVVLEKSFSAGNLGQKPYLSVFLVLIRLGRGKPMENLILFHLLVLDTGDLILFCLIVKNLILFCLVKLETDDVIIFHLVTEKLILLHLPQEVEKVLLTC